MRGDVKAPMALPPPKSMRMFAADADCGPKKINSPTHACANRRHILMELPPKKTTLHFNGGHSSFPRWLSQSIPRRDRGLTLWNRPPARLSLEPQ